LEQVKPLVMDRFEKALAVQVMDKNLETLKAEIRKLKDKPEQIQQYADEAVKKFGLENFHTMARAESRYELDDDAVVKPLKEGYEDFRAQWNRGGLAQSFGTFPSFLDFLFGNAQFPTPSVVGEVKELPPMETRWFFPMTGKSTWVCWGL